MVGLDAAEYRDTEVADGSWTGFTDLAVESAVVDEFYDEGVVDLYEARDLPVNTGITLVAGSQSGLGRGERTSRSIASPTGPCSTSGPASRATHRPRSAHR